MSRKTVSCVMLGLLVVSTLALAFKIPPARADGAIYIWPDGTMTPSTAPIQRDGQTYTLTDDIDEMIYIMKSGITLDGAGHVIQASSTNIYTDGIYLENVIAAVIENVTIRQFPWAIQLLDSSSISISDNYIENVSGGIGIAGSSSIDNTISGNTIVGAEDGIFLGLGETKVVQNKILDCSTFSITILPGCNNNLITQNYINGAHGGNSYGMAIHSDNNIVSENTIMNCALGMWQEGQNNIIFHNNFINNTWDTTSVSLAQWDNGYPSGGNYWSDYNGVDLLSGPYQDLPGSDGIGDTPFFRGVNCTDRYPLMQPWGSPRPPFTFATCSPNTVSIGLPVTCTATVSGLNPTGTITWSTSSIGGSFNQSVCALSNEACSTTYTDSLTGSVTITASYSGDPNNMPSSGTFTLTVTSGGPVYYSANYTSVQAAIDAAPPGATVIIAPGFYTESLILDKPLTIIGEKDLPVFEGGASAIYLTLLSGASGSNITGIEITNVAEGILVLNASNVSIYGNIMASIGRSGIVLEGNNATNNIIYGNIFQETPTPINLTDSAGNNTIYGNIITSQTSVTLNIAADGNVVYGNSMSGSQILLNLTDSKDNTFYHNNFMATDPQITVLVSGNNTWDDGHSSGGNYWSITPSFVGSNNTDRYPLTKPWPLATGHCIAVTSVVAAKTVIGQGFSANMTVCVADNGEYAESFNVTAYANATAIGTQQLNNLNASCQMILTFVWNTASLTYGNYTISAYVQPVANQTDVSGNDFTLGTLKVTIPGDVNGDFKVDLKDLVILANAYGSKPGYPNWNANADINGNGVVDLADLVILTQHYGQHYP